MALYEYLSIKEARQLELLWQEGKHLETAAVEGEWHQLYALWDFFVEVRYSSHFNKITGHTAFRQGELLEKYLHELPPGLL